ncbi:UNVERIFIED_CONTAM: hypothetical protein GTU68_000711 [Idotea baltica]|nr:hypothetical protein [Idotea baltica]
MDFVLQHVVNVGQLQSHDAFSHVEPGEIAGILDEAGRFFSEVVAPTNRTGDVQGSQRNDDGSVTTPDGIAEAYSKLVDAGWGAISFDPEYGGGGFPTVIGLAIQEMLTSANMGFSLCPLLTQGAVHLLEEHASEEQKLTWVPKMVSGEWTGTMNLTEPQAGSDVGALTTKAVRNDDGTYAITGQKIFITWGEHDVADNIVHLVLARTADAPPGTKGISVFIVPKFLLNDDGTPGEPNTLECVSLEHKLGIHCSPTAVMAFENATGYVIGEEQTGMRSMFTMMNSARLSVGTNGIQAIDLIGRKLPIRDGAAVGELLDQTQAHAESLGGDLASLTKPLVEGVSACRESSAWLLTNRGDAALAGATPYLRLLSTVVAGGLMAKGAAVAQAELAAGASGDRAEFLTQKIVTSTFFIEQLVPAQVGLMPSIMAGNDVLANYHPVV